MNYKLDRDLKYTWKNRPKPSPNSLPDRTCNIPQVSALIDKRGRVLHCECDGWLPFPSGNILDFTSISQIFNNPIQNKFADACSTGNFKFCSSGVCGIQKSSIEVKQVKQLYVNLDDSCNLQCPSCREHLIFHKNGPIYELKKRQFNHLSNLVNAHDERLNFSVAGDGDAFASTLYKEFLYSIKENDKFTFIVRTNGLLIDKRLENYPVVNQIKGITISVDAASAETYRKVRYPGDWKTLHRNLDYVVNKLNLKTTLNFVIQKDNLHEVEDFVTMCKQYGVKPNFAQLEDWGTWHNFSEHNVFDIEHSQYEQCCETIDYLRSQGLWNG